jgi:hypothetical protein
MKTCKNCGISLSGRQPGAKFCSDSCRAKHWRQRKGVTKTANALNGIAPNPQPTMENQHVQYAPPAPADTASQWIISNLERERDKLERVVEQQDKENRDQARQISQLEKDISEMEKNSEIEALKGENSLMGVATKNPELIGQLLPLLSGLFQNQSGGAPQLAGGNDEKLAAIAEWWAQQDDTTKNIMFNIFNQLAFAKNNNQFEETAEQIRNIIQPAANG